MEKENKKVKILENKEKEVRIEIEGEDHTLLAPLTSKLLENEKVDLATYNIKHTLMSNPVLYVKMKEGDPIEAVKSAAASLASDFEEFERKYKAAVV
ncbi:MAG: DNA-directed RNA polymerase subunit L [Candidatus Syntrophoarchaeum sp.]|nr:DNA-directed RNA polymerase subunit L [Methanomicrobia archaeon]MBL7118258.1 DNA-directed RNA polymerase subunit L [Candidatus Syntrophoarchaeum sp.]